MSWVAPELVWGLVPRFVGLLYIIAFASLLPQLQRVIGSRGLGHIGPRLSAIRRDYPGLRGFHSMPTVLWLSHSDRTLRLIPWLGMAAGAICVYGGPLAPAAHALDWILWLSLEPALLIFPWDTMLQEAGFLSLFLPGVAALPSLDASNLPYPSVAFVFRFFVLRLMLGFGKVKFLGSKRDDALYLRGFFAWSSVTPLAWLAHHLPAFVLRAMLYGMFVCEVIAPLLGFFAGTPRLLAYALLTSLMFAIQVMGNWGFFNVGYAMLCVCLLDTSSSIFDLSRDPWRSTLLEWPALALNAAMLVLFVTGLLYLVVFDSWTTRTLVHWPLQRFTWKRRWLRILIGYLRAISPFRIVNGYGVFPPNSLPPMAQVALFEGSHDGATWLPYRYQHTPTSATERPRYVAPHHPRIDMAAAYATTCVFDASFFGALAGDGTAYTTYTRSSWLERVCQRLLEGDPLFTRLFRDNPFPDAPPKLMRVSTVALTPASLAVRRATGAWWHVRRCGLCVQPHGRAEWPEAIALPEPEVFHPDWVDYKRRALPIRLMTRAFEGGVEPDQAILSASDLTAEDVAEFWAVLVPRLNEKRGDFSTYVAEATAIDAHFGMAKLARFERVLERFSWLLRLRSERHWYADAQPNLPIDSNFRYHMFLHELVMDGRDAFLSYLADPALIVARLASSSDERQLWTLAILRHRLMLAHIATFRWTLAGSDTFKRKLHGLFEYYPVLARVVPPGEEFCPEITKHEDGEHTIRDFYPPPVLGQTH
jgi:hypothetical protein